MQIQRADLVVVTRGKGEKWIGGLSGITTMYKIDIYKDFILV